MIEDALRELLWWCERLFPEEEVRESHGIDEPMLKAKNALR